MRKIRVGLIFGGRSGEHEVSLRSAAAIYAALDKSKYEVKLLGVDKEGGWHAIDARGLPAGAEMRALPSGEKSIIPQEEKVDVYFPIIHGTFGEDGSLQGMLELMDAAYVGAGVLGSAVGMDKDVMKRLLRDAGVPIAKYQTLRGKQDVVKQKKYPVFVKPANMGSSVGVNKCNNDEELKEAIEEAFAYDTKVIIEEEIKGREIEVSVLGNDDPVASVPGEVKTAHDFYDYQAKYIDENGAITEIPAKLPEEMIRNIQELAVEAYKVLECSGMARVDMFLKPDGGLVVNEINTLPGFTSISMYPKMWEASGVKFSELLDKLIFLAVEKKKQKDALKRSYN